MRYFIGYAFQNEEKEKIDLLRKNLASRFSIQEALKIPPHITLYSPFETEKIELLKPELQTHLKQQQPIELAITGFNSFDEAVWFLDIEHKPELFALKQGISHTIENVLHLSEEKRGSGIHFHCTLAYKDVTPEIFLNIGDFLKKEPLPISHFILNSVTLFRHEERWVPEATFSLAS